MDRLQQQKQREEKKVEFHRVDLGGTCVNFPFSPYPLQEDYMKAVLRCLEKSENGLLESPTGTGKTLSLLCSTLAWLEKVRAEGQLTKLQPKEPGSEGDWGPVSSRHKIIYSSRTHSQLSQAVAELGRTTYRYLKVSILGSRDQLCVNPAVVELTNSREKLHSCQARVKAKTCIFHTNVEKAKVERDELRENKIMDIEDLHKLGKKHSFCPYYMSRELYQTADIIFMPYNYLLDDSIRKSLDIDFAGSVIIFDEGHNVQKLCEEASSYAISSQDLALAIKDLDEVAEQLRNPEPTLDDADVAPKDLRESDLMMIKDSLLDLEAKFGTLLGGKESLTKPGTFAATLFGPFIQMAVVQCLELVVEHANSSNTAAFTPKGRGATKLLDFIKGAFNESVTTEDLEKLYKVHVVNESKSEGSKGSFLKSKSENLVLNLWCFSPGFSMRRLAKLGPRSIILTSGTLSPLAATAEEIGIPFPVQLENCHVVGASQVWCGVLGAGADKTPLNSSFKSRSDPKYLNSLGQTVINLIKLVPKGVLVFFPSYGLLNSTREFWQQAGIWGRIDQIKKIVVEPQRKDALSGVMKEYYDEVRDGRGGIFMAVCRGKVAEGLDFADDNGRAVLITGLPYPPFKDARVELKRQFLDDQVRAKAGGLSGAKWYQLEAFRATNQAIGRVIRHSRDHGAVIFLDQRFGDGAARSSLSKWLQPFFQKFQHPGPAVQALANFFKTDSAVGQLRKTAVAVQTALISSSRHALTNAVKRPLQVVQEAAPLLPELYQGGGPPSGQGSKAASIFSTSSAAIGFTSSSNQLRPSSSNTAGCCSSTASQPRKKKIRLMTNSSAFPSSEAVEGETVIVPGEADDRVAPGAEVLEDSKKYVRSLKLLLSPGEMSQFRAAVTAYKVAREFGAVVGLLEGVMSRHTTLLRGFKTFLRKEHYSQFENFCAKYQ